MTRVPMIAALFPLSLLAGCATALPPVQVTRFHVPEAPRAETVAIEAAPGNDAGGIEFRTYANAVAAALGRAGFTVVDPGKTAPLVAVVDYELSVDRPVDRRRSPVSVGVGGSTGSYGSGLGVGIGIDLSGPPKAVIARRLSVRLKRAATGDALWEGRAETAAREGTPAAQPALAAGKLADALFRDYPGATGETITVK